MTDQQFKSFVAIDILSEGFFVTFCGQTAVVHGLIDLAFQQADGVLTLTNTIKYVKSNIERKKCGIKIFTQNGPLTIHRFNLFHVVNIIYYNFITLHFKSRFENI